MLQSNRLPLQNWAHPSRYFGTVMILSFRTNRPWQTVQTLIRLLLEEQSDQGLHCLLFHLCPFDKVLYSLASLFEF